MPSGDEQESDSDDSDDDMNDDEKEVEEEFGSENEDGGDENQEEEEEGGEEESEVEKEEAEEEQQDAGEAVEEDEDDDVEGELVMKPKASRQSTEVSGEEKDEETGAGAEPLDDNEELDARDEDGNIAGEEDEEEELGRVRKRRKVDPTKIKRQAVMQHYNQPASFTAPTALLMLKLVGGRTGSHVALDLLWQAVLGVTDQYQRQRLSEADYESYCELLHLQLAEHLSSEHGRYTVGEGDLAVVVPGAHFGHIEEAPDFRFFLYRHWSLFDAMCYSPYVAAKLSTWQSHGTTRLQELLAKMGVPLEQCKQSYSFMSPAMKDHFRKQIVGQVRA